MKISLTQLFMAASLLVAPVLAQCPNFSLDVSGDSCRGDLDDFNDAFEQLYAGLMRLVERETMTGNGGISHTKLNALTQSSKTVFDYEDKDESAGELVRQASDGVYTIKKNNGRRLKEEVGGDEELLMEFVEAMELNHRVLTSPDCGTTSWCLQFSWCCIICPHYCPTRRYLKEEPRELAVPIEPKTLDALTETEAPSSAPTSESQAPDLVHPCDYLDTVDPDDLPGCLAGARIKCTPQ